MSVYDCSYLAPICNMDASDDGNLIAACASIVEVVVDMKHCILLLSSHTIPVICLMLNYSEFIYSHTRLYKCCIEWCCINIDDNNVTGIPSVFGFYFSANHFVSQTLVGTCHFFSEMEKSYYRL